MSSDDWRQGLQELMADFIRRQSEAKAKARAEQSKVDRTAVARAWQAELVDNGLAGPGWPKTAGGLELSLEDQLDYYRMTSAAGVPAHPCQVSFIVAPVLIKYGSAEQQQRFLRPLLRADEFWCQGFSEPGAGSDLASLSTRAVREGTCTASTVRRSGRRWPTRPTGCSPWCARVCRDAARTGSPTCSFRCTAPASRCGRCATSAEAPHFAEVFFDDVEVPVEHRVGEEGKGWSIMRTSLGHERATAFLADEFKHRRTADQVLDLLVEQGLDSDPLVRQEIARMESGCAQSRPTVRGPWPRCCAVRIRAASPR